MNGGEIKFIMDYVCAGNVVLKHVCFDYIRFYFVIFCSVIKKTYLA
jgi:hypothetical protein